MHDIMIDLETLGTRPGCKIVSLGAVLFNDTQVLRELYLVFNLAATPGDIDADTVKWWMQQSDDAREVFKHPHLSDASTICGCFSSWYEQGKDRDGELPNVWAHGVAFDIPIFEWMYRVVGRPLPWNYRKLRDTRTLFDLAEQRGWQKPEDTEGVKHNAVDDARWQALAVISARKALFA